MAHRFAYVLAVLALLPATPSAIGQGKNSNGPITDNEPGVGRITRWLDPAPLTTRLPPALTARLRPQDVLSYAAPGVLYPARNIGLQCQGVNATLADVPQRAARAGAADGAYELRFGEADFDGSRVFRLQANVQDLLPTGVSPRCELVSYPMPGSALPSSQNFWLAFSFWADDWAGTADEQLIAQMHIQEPRNLLLNPFFALVVKGRELRVELRHNDRDIPDQASTQLVTTARLPMPTRQWVTAVVQARMTTHATQEPFLRLWFNGTLVTDYSGPLGYALPPGGFAYAKVGVYHWTAGNPWDLKIPTRAMMLRAMLTVLDATSRYTADDLRAAVAGPEQR